MAVLLLGTVGSGKSTLGNFLIKTDGTQTFATATTNKAQTQYVMTKAFRPRLKRRPMRKLTVIDTPGLNESDDILDFERMVDIIECLQNVEEVLACVLVVKFDSVIDAQFRATIQYYKKHLPKLFERNVIIIMTNFATDYQSKEIRERHEIDVEQIKTSTVREVVRCASLAANPMLFTINSLPYDDEEYEVSCNVRAAILKYIATRESLDTTALKVAKSDRFKAEDLEEIKCHKEEIDGFRQRCQQNTSRVTEDSDEIMQIKQEITTKRIQLSSKEKDLEDKDSPDLIKVASWSVSKEWKTFRWLSEEFVVTSPCEIEKVKKWTNGHCEWKDYHEDEDRVSGKVQGNFMRGVYASLSVLAQKRKRYKREIVQLKKQVTELKSQIQSCEQRLSVTKYHRKQCNDDINSLDHDIKRLNGTIQVLASDYMTLKEARDRLEKVKSNRANILEL